MKLLDTNIVCEMLGISRSTLYRWCDLSDIESIEYSYLPRHNKIEQLANKLKNINRSDKNNILKVESKNEVIFDFPRPYKIGRQLKWDESEIINWLETKRI